jgi:hypothetical protein
MPNRPTPNLLLLMAFYCLIFAYGCHPATSAAPLRVQVTLPATIQELQKDKFEVEIFSADNVAIQEAIVTEGEMTLITRTCDIVKGENREIFVINLFLRKSGEGNIFYSTNLPMKVVVPPNANYRLVSVLPSNYALRRDNISVDPIDEHKGK